MNVPSLPEIYLVTCAADTIDKRAAVQRFLNSARQTGFHSVDISCRARRGEFKTRDKIEGAVMLAESGKPGMRLDDWIVTVDAHDLFFNLGPEELANRLAATRADIVLGAVRRCSSSDPRVTGKTCVTLYPRHHQKNVRDLVGSKQPYASAGFQAARVSTWQSLREQLERAKGDEVVSDQAFWHLLVGSNSHQYTIFVDHEGSIVFNFDTPRADPRDTIGNRFAGAPLELLNASVIPAVFHFPGQRQKDAEYLDALYRRRFPTVMR